MKLTEVTKSNRAYLYEGLNRTDSKSMLLWESAGQAIAEAQLTADQITQLFQQIEQGATASGTNRTALGKGKDVASAVNQAYQDLKGKVINSQIMQNFDQMYDQAAAKLKQATGGDAGTMQYVEKYRNFAKAHPIAQSLIYSALIAAAGISGAGAGGAAALGLLKMTDKLLQGEKFSKAAVAGAETGALAYGASQLGKAIKGADQTTNIPTDDTDFSTSQEWTEIGGQPVIPGEPLTRNQMAAIKMGLQSGNTYPQDIMDMYNSQVSGVSLPSEVTAPNQEAISKAAKEYIASTPAQQAEIRNVTGMTDAALKAAAVNFESVNLTAKQVKSLFESIAIEEGLWDSFKTKVLGEPEEREEVKQQFKQGVAKVAGAVGAQAQRIGHNLTTKVTADKLQKAWKAAGSPTDSEQIVAILQQQGVDADVINSAFKSFKITPSATSKFAWVTKLTPEQKQQLLAQVNKLVHTGGRVKGQELSQNPNAIRQRQARAAKKQPAVFKSNRTA